MRNFFQDFLNGLRLRAVLRRLGFSKRFSCLCGMRWEKTVLYKKVLYKGENFVASVKGGKNEN